MSLCDSCIDPGSCCRDISLNFDPPAGTGLEALAWIASIQPRRGELGLPFLPLERRQHQDTNGQYERWHWTCGMLTEDGRCGAYETRPDLCRTFRPGEDNPCAMRCPSFLEEGCRPLAVDWDWQNGKP